MTLKRAWVLGVAASLAAGTFLSAPLLAFAAPSSSPRVTVAISLSHARVGAGTPIAGIATVTNLTSRVVLVRSCARDGWLFVGIHNRFVKFDPVIATVACAPSIRLAPGDNRFRITVRTTYQSCTNDGPRIRGPRCTPKGPPPLPLGYYDTRAVILGLPSGTPPPASLAVTVMPKPTSSVGSSVKIRGANVTLDRIFDPSARGVERQFFSPRAGRRQTFPFHRGYRYVSARITITNTDRARLDAAIASTVAMLGTDNRWYLSVQRDTSACTENHCAFFGSGVVSLAQGQSKTGVVTMSVPDGVRIGLVRLDWMPRSANWGPEPAA